MKVMITGGGTGGHLYPGLAVARELRRRDPDTEIVYVGTSRGLEVRVVPGHGYRLLTVDVRGLPRRVSPAALSSAWHLVKSLFQARRIIRTERPDAVVGTGGYASGPVVLAAHRAGLPCVLQEQNSFPGITNRWLSRFADRVHTAYAEAAAHLRRPERVRLTGNPVLMDASGRDRTAASRVFGLDPERPVVLVMGGSQGARGLNTAMEAAAPLFADAPFQVLWQCGTGNYDGVRGRLRSCPDNVVLIPYIDDMGAAYAAAALAVARAGAMSLSEMALFGVPAVLVPLPTAAGDHQRKNAAAREAAGSAVCLEEAGLTGAALAGTVRPLMADAGRLDAMSGAARGLATPDAAAAVADTVLELTNTK